MEARVDRPGYIKFNESFAANGTGTLLMCDRVYLL